MNTRRISTLTLASSVLLLGGLGGYLAAYAGRAAPQDRTITITAHKYAYDPPILDLNRGDRVTIRLKAADVTHGFYLEGYDLDAKVRPENDTFWVRHPSKDSHEEWEEVSEYTFVANKTGKFRYRCSLTCGYMHPFMQGEMIVRPNYLFSTSLGLSLGLMVSLLIVIKRSPGGTAP